MPSSSLSKEDLEAVLTSWALRKPRTIIRRRRLLSLEPVPMKRRIATARRPVPISLPHSPFHDSDLEAVLTSWALRKPRTITRRCRLLSLEPVPMKRRIATARRPVPISMPHSPFHDSDGGDLLEQRLQAALGEFRGAFKREISQQNLGPMFGGYGSFLPVNIRGPSDPSSSARPPPNLVSSNDSRACSNSTARNPVASIKRKIGNDDLLEQRLEAALGRCRAAFKGEISQQNLGPMFGGYGTFLPLNIRAPSNRSSSARPPPNPASSKAFRACSNSTAPNPVASINDDLLEQRLEAALGRCRAAFEGELSEENLGLMFGGYGTFLTVNMRGPSNRSSSARPPPNPVSSKGARACSSSSTAPKPEASIKREAAGKAPSSSSYRCQSLSRAAATRRDGHHVTSFSIRGH